MIEYRLYTRLVASNSFAPEFREEANEDDSVPLITEGGSLLSSPAHTRLNNSIQEFMAMWAIAFFRHRLPTYDIWAAGSFICKLN